MKKFDEKKRLKNIGIIKSLSGPELIEAHRIIDQGATTPLIYFWYNLYKMFFYPNFKLEDIHKQAIYYIGLQPEFEKQIITWIQAYEKRVKVLEEEMVTEPGA